MVKFKDIVFDHDGTLVDTTVYPRSLFKGLKELLHDLNSQGVNCYIWTARNRQSTTEILTELGVIGQFKAMSCGGEMAQKPSVEGIENLGINPSKDGVLVIGDSLGDVIGGSSFGAFSAGALWGHGTDRGRAQMQKVGADICFATVEEFKKFLKDKI